MNCLLTTHTPETFHGYMNVLVPPIIAAVGDSFYKITGEALLVLQQLVKVIRPLGKEAPLPQLQIKLSISGSINYFSCFVHYRAKEQFRLHSFCG